MPDTHDEHGGDEGGRMALDRFAEIENRYGVGRRRLDTGTKTEMLRVLHELIAAVRWQFKAAPLDPARKTCAHCGHWFLSHRSDVGCTFCECKAGRAFTGGDELSAAPEDRLSDQEWASYSGALAELHADPTEALRAQLAAATARAESATVLPERWRALIAERDAANERAEKAEALVAGFGPACCVCGRILGYRNYRNQLFCWPCADGEPKTADAAPDGLSGPVERSEASGGHGEGSNSSTTAAELSEPEGGCPWCGTLQKLDADGLVSLHRLPNDLLCPGGTRRPNDDTTEDGQ